MGSIVAATIAAICAAIIGKRFDDRKKLRERLECAQKDIAFLLAVEEEHCELHIKTINKSLKLTIRDDVRKKGQVWSGKFTPGRIINYSD
ncbi:MAG: hypothetical protein KGI54_15175 [Pseudomonadota bacterium]|nr:hypothetical protein [Pseudomonadota bacterium]